MAEQLILKGTLEGHVSRPPTQSVTITKSKRFERTLAKCESHRAIQNSRR